jgi:peptide/nickel transport system permease protein
MTDQKIRDEDKIEAVQTQAAIDAVQLEGLEVQSLTQWQLARRKFFQHKLAMTSLVILLLVFAAALLADFIAPYPFAETNVPDRSMAPTFVDNHYFGTDKIGRDYFSRTLYGTRTSVYVAFIVVGLSTAIGVVIGGFAGYYGGKVDNLLMRMTDLFLTVPFLAILLVLSAFLGAGSPIRVAVILGLLFWTGLARIIRGEFLSLREKEFVEAAKVLGASDSRIIFRHILPNTMGPIIVNATLTVASAILVEAALS